MSMAEKIRSNKEVHGLAWTLQWARSRKINKDTVSFALFGKYGMLSSSRLF